MRLPQGICGGNIPLHLRIHASTGTELMAYQGYGTDDVETKMGPQAGPVEIDLSGFGSNNDSLFHPFTTTMVEIVLNREPSPLNAVSQIFTFL
jgi:hypothetical protein